MIYYTTSHYLSISLVEQLNISGHILIFCKNCKNCSSYKRFTMYRNCLHEIELKFGYFYSDYILDILPTQGVYCVYTLTKGSISII